MEEIVCNVNQLTEIKLGNLAQLRKLFCRNNCLTDIDYSVLSPEKLTELSIRNNNLSEQNISVFSKFTKLKLLRVGNDDKEEIEKGKYNHFVGSLNSLKELTDLEILDISNTDIGQLNIKNLPEKIREIG